MDVLAFSTDERSSSGTSHRNAETASRENIATLPTDMALYAATGVAICGCVVLCAADYIFSWDVEQVVCILLFALGYVVFPVTACVLILTRMSSTVHSSTSLLQLSPLVAQVLYLLAPTVHSSVEASTTAFICQANVTPEGGPVAPAQCTVCLDDVLPGASARALHCGHVFHKGCADAWLLSARRNCCPLCLRTVCTDRDDHMQPLPEKTHAISDGKAPCAS
jgi:Ring finger domain